MLASIDRGVSKLRGERPALYSDAHGGRIEVHPRSSEAKKVRLPDGEIRCLGRSDIIHYYDANGMLVERNRIKHAKSVHVLSFEEEHVLWEKQMEHLSKELAVKRAAHPNRTAFGPDARPGRSTSEPQEKSAGRRNDSTEYRRGEYQSFVERIRYISS